MLQGKRENVRAADLHLIILIRLDRRLLSRNFIHHPLQELRRYAANRFILCYLDPAR